MADVEEDPVDPGEEQAEDAPVGDEGGAETTAEEAQGAEGDAASVRGSHTGAADGGAGEGENLANELAESLSADEKFAVSGFGKEELVEMFTMAIKRIDEKREENGHQHQVSVPGELLENIPSKSSKEKKVESWLRNRSDNKSFVEIDPSDLDEINDGFTRMFDRVAVDYRMNMIRGICGRMCVEYDLETGLATSINGNSEKWRFDWRAKSVKASRPIMVLDEGVKERMVIALCREMKRQSFEDPTAGIEAPETSSSTERDIQM